MATKSARTTGEVRMRRYWIFGDVRPSRKRTSEEVYRVSLHCGL